jgi:hypothetical protein
MEKRTPVEKALNRTRGSFHVVADTATEAGLMPYEAVAKAIFVKANGLDAYCKTTGIAHGGD